MKKLFKIVTALALLSVPALAAFNDQNFNFGRTWSESFDENTDFSGKGLSHLAVWLGGNAEYNQYWEGAMIRAAVKNNLTPVFYAYVIAEYDKKVLDLEDCDVRPEGRNHCTDGAETIRSGEHWNNILNRYYSYANGVSNEFHGSEITTIWLIEPDFYQYSESADKQRGYTQTNGGIEDCELVNDKFKQIVGTIRKFLAHAKIAVDISPWIEKPEDWYSCFDPDDIDYLFTSGGRTEGDNSLIRSRNGMTWAQASGFLNKKIIADDGYGVGGEVNSDYLDWLNVDNLRNRIADGVIGITIAEPVDEYYNYAVELGMALGNDYDEPTEDEPIEDEPPFEDEPIVEIVDDNIPSGFTNTLSDFEDGLHHTILDGWWNAYIDAASQDDQGNHPNSRIGNEVVGVSDYDGVNPVYQILMDADNGSNYMVGITDIQLDQAGYEWAPYVAISMDLHINIDNPVDLSNCAAISYDYKGARHQFTAVMSGDAQGELTAYDRHYVWVDGSDTWQTKTILWTQLKQEYWGVPLVLDKSLIGGFQWIVRGEDEYNYSSTHDYLYVDNLRCLGMRFPTTKGVIVDSITQTVTLRDGNEVVSIPTDVVVNNVNFERNFHANQVSTVTLPFSTVTGMNVNAKFYSLNSVTRNPETGRYEVRMRRVPNDALVANTPYVVLPQDNNLYFDLNGNSVTLNTSTMQNATANGWGFVGSYNHKSWSEEDPELGHAYGFSAENADNVKAGEFVKVGTGAEIYPMYAYLVRNAHNPVSGASFAARSPSVEELPETMDLALIDGDDEDVTVVGRINMRTGKITTNRWFDMKGRKQNAKPTAKGAYYKNGQKVIVK